jgi:gluconokinase
MDIPHAIVLIGISGAGKTTVGQMLADKLGWGFFDADDFHPPANIAKMSQGIPLVDSDRLPWLERLRKEVIDPAWGGNPVVLACSALKESYRKSLGIGEPGVAGVFLESDLATLEERLSARSGHYMKSEMLASQLASLEIPSPAEVIHISNTAPPDEIADRIIAALGLPIGL